MNKLLTLLLGGSIVALSLPTFAGVSYVFVSHGDETLSLTRCVTSKGKVPIKCEERDDRPDVGFSTSWPANQYRGRPGWWWSGLSGRVVGIHAKNSLRRILDPGNLVTVNTSIPDDPDTAEDEFKSSGSNFIGISPDGRTAWNSAREVDLIQEIDTDPGSPTFGTILTELDVKDLDPDTPPTATTGGARPCDATITPDGRLFMEPDLGGESMTLVDTRTKAMLQVQPFQLDPAVKVRPFMATTNGEIVFVENFEGPDGSYDVWDVSGVDLNGDQPVGPIYLKKIVRDCADFGPLGFDCTSGLGSGPQTSEFTPDGQYAYLIMRGANGSPSEINVVPVADPLSPDYLTIVNRIMLPDGCGAQTGDFSNDGRYFFIGCPGTGAVYVVDNDTQTLVEDEDTNSGYLEIAVGPSPRGVIVR